MMNSGDGSELICKRYSETYSVFRLISQKNAGPAAARNNGISNAKGTYVYFVDADDYLEPDLLELMVAASEKSQADMVICNYFIEKNNGNSIRHEYFCIEGLYEGNELTALNTRLIDDVSSNRIPPYSWVRMIRKECLDRTTTRYENGMIRSEDYHFFVRLQFEQSKIYVITKPLYHYIEMENSITHRYVPKYWESVKLIYQSLSDSLPRNEEVKRRLDTMLIQRTMVALNNSSWAEEKKRFKDEVFAIVEDKNVNDAVKGFCFKDGLKKFGMFFVLLRLKCYWGIYKRYGLKRNKN